MPISRTTRFLAELRRRKVYHVAVAYVVVGLGVLGAAEVVLDPLGLGEARPLVVILVLLGFPLALVLAWAYELRPEEEAPAPASGGDRTGDDASGTEGSRKSIVVLPFDNMSPDPGDAYFSEGLTDEIITHLSRLHSLRVISRSSAIALKGTRKDVRTIGRELGVQYVLEGSVRKAGPDLRITAQTDRRRHRRAPVGRTVRGGARRRLPNPGGGLPGHRGGAGSGDQPQGTGRALPQAHG